MSPIKSRQAPGQESWDKQEKNGSLKVMVNKRFIVEIEARGIDDPSVLRTALDRTNLKKLAALIRTVFAQPDAHSARDQLRSVADQLRPIAADVADLEHRDRPRSA